MLGFGNKQMGDESHILQWAVAGVGAAFTALTGAVVGLYRRNEKHIEALQERSEQCEKDRAELWRKIYHLEQRFDE